MATKKSFLFIFLSSIIFGCGTNEPKKEEAKTDSMAKKVVLDYPYTAKYSLNWQPGDEQNAVVVLNSIKKYMDGDIAGSFSDFADSITFVADKFLFTGTKDSLINLMTPMRAQIASMTFQPDTWLTAYYPDKNDTWVTVWGVQKWILKNGKTDSFYIAEDVRLKDGKIQEIDEKMRMFAEPKAKK
jgi:hypothetical protein